MKIKKRVTFYLYRCINTVYSIPMRLLSFLSLYRIAQFSLKVVPVYK